MRFFVDMYYQVASSITIDDDMHDAVAEACGALMPPGMVDLRVSAPTVLGHVSVTATVRATDPPSALEALQPVAADVLTAVLGGTDDVTVIGYAVEPEPVAALTPDATRVLDALIDRLDQPGPVVIEKALTRYAAAAIAPVPTQAPPTSIVDDLGAC